LKEKRIAFKAFFEGFVPTLPY